MHDDEAPVVDMVKPIDANDEAVNSSEQKVLQKRKPATASGNKPHRKRKRKHFNGIREQMEFYFGDANLSKDRFLKQLIDKDPYVPLEVFLTFNKMKALSNNVAEIAQSLTNSQLLELDETQQKVRRKTALPAERNVDDMTLYVESIPPTANHDWVKQNFERFGNVTYVSLPKYSKSRKIKEFGFIEFEKQESVARAVKAFQEFKGVLSMQETDPAELKSVKAFIKEQSEQDMADSDVAADEEEKQSKKKRKNKASLDDEATVAKKLKTDTESSAVSSVTEDDSDNESSATTDNENTIANKTAADGDAPLDESGKKRRRKKKKKSKKLKTIRQRSLAQDNDASFFDLKVLPKRDWKRLRNKYLNLQREKVAELKRKAWRAAQQQHSRENLTESAEASAGGPSTPAKKVKPNERKLQKMNMNFYGAGEAEIPSDGNSSISCNKIKEFKINAALERAPLFNYEPGLIVEVAFLEPCVTIKEFKADMRQYGAVKYVDVKEGDMQAQLRLESASAAMDFIKQVSCAEYNCKLLGGEAELEYWRKIEQDREMKFNKKVKVPQRRGREKVKKLLTTKHIRFGDEDEVEQREV